MSLNHIYASCFPAMMWVKREQMFVTVTSRFLIKDSDSGKVGAVTGRLLFLSSFKLFS